MASRIGPIRGACPEGGNGGKWGEMGEFLLPTGRANLLPVIAGLFSARKHGPERLVGGRSSLELAGEPPLPFAVVLMCSPAHIEDLYVFFRKAGEIRISERRAIR